MCALNAGDASDGIAMFISHHPKPFQTAQRKDATVRDNPRPHAVLSLNVPEGMTDSEAMRGGGPWR